MTEMTIEKLRYWERKLTDQGKLVEAGWIGLRLMLPLDMPQIQVDEMRRAFMCGAYHLFSSLISILDPGEEPTDDDLKRMDLIHQELELFGKELEAAIRKPGNT